MEKMFLEKRPTCITVISWAWIVIGGLMSLSSIMVLFMLVMMGLMAPEEKDVPFMLMIFPLIAVIQLGIAVLGLVAGINFLKMKVWARNVLEVLTWLLLIFMVGFMIFWFISWIAMSFSHASFVFAVMGAVMGLFSCGIYGVPLVIMLKYLRGDKIRDAIAGNAEKSSPSEVSTNSSKE